MASTHLGKRQVEHATATDPARDTCAARLRFAGKYPIEIGVRELLCLPSTVSAHAGEQTDSMESMEPMESDLCSACSLN